MYLSSEKHNALHLNTMSGWLKYWGRFSIICVIFQYYDLLANKKWCGRKLNNKKI